MRTLSQTPDLLEGRQPASEHPNRIDRIELLPFQTRFIRKVVSDDIDTAALSLPRGNGKSRLAGHLGKRIMDPSDPLFTPGTESILAAGSLEQCRIAFRFTRGELEASGHLLDYRISDSYSRIEIMHKPTRTKLRAIGSNGKTAMGLTSCPWVIADEPGAWETNGGQLLNDAIQTAQGKPGSRLRAVYIGTLAPAVDGWWHQLVKGGSHGSVHVTALVGDADKWEQWREIKRVNPLAAKFPELKKKLLEERDEAGRDTRLKARFLSYRLNCPAGDESVVLLQVPDWQRALAREVPARVGRPIVGVDLGGGRAWSAAVAIWQTGRVEAIAIAPGHPSIEEQEKRDHVSAGTYRALVETGALRVCEGKRVPPPEMLTFAIRSAWGDPVKIICDRFRLDELKDSINGAFPAEPRMTRWSSASEDIRALRKITLDGPLAPAKESRDLLTASLAVAMVKNDDQGSTRLVKRANNNTARDDAAAALVLAAGGFERAERKPASRIRTAIVG